MFNVIECRENSRVLRRTWYLTRGSRAELRSRWTVEELSPSSTNAAFRRNQPVTKACETEPIVECA
jgi:hypothetical protein